MKQFFSILILFVGLPFIGKCQTDTMINILQAVQLDEVVISASTEELDLNAFINLVIEDSTFYQSFRNLRFVDHEIDAEMGFLSKKEKRTASYKTLRKQKMKTARCRNQVIESEEVSGDYYDKKNELNYFTAKMFSKLFFSDKEICEEKISARKNINELKGMEKQKAQLAQMIFNPGTKIDGIPLMGNKLSIFEKENQEFYDFYIEDYKYNDVNVWRFQVSLKKAYQNQKDKFPINQLSTLFDKDNFQILFRSYELSYNSLYSFDVKMEVELQKVDAEVLIPAQIKYQGTWKIPLKKRESGSVEVIFN